MISIKRIGSCVLELRDSSQTFDYWIALRNHLEACLMGLEEVLNTEDSVVLIYQNEKSCKKQLLDDLVKSFKGADEDMIAERKIFEVLVSYTRSNTDLVDVAKRLNLSEEEVILKHSEATYKISMFGFIPGFAYLTGLPSTLQIARKKEPSIQLKSGSVAIAEHYSGIYPVDSPGGWYVLGFTDFSFLNQAQLPMSGDLVKFIPAFK